MKTFLKIFALVVGIGILVVAGVVIVGVFWAMDKGEGFVEDMEAMTEEAEAFAQNVDEEGCIEETVRRHIACSGLTCSVKSAAFLAICLGESQMQEGFCDSVPDSSDMGASERWIDEQCDHYGVDGEIGCAAIFSVVQSYCHDPVEYGDDDSAGGMMIDEDGGQ